MGKIRRKIYKLRLKNLVLETKIKDHFGGNDREGLFIISSPKYKNKVKEDLNLVKCFLKNHISCEIISWRDNPGQRLCLIRSAWGYHKHLDEFKEFLEKNRTINPPALILDNMNKQKQYEILKKYDLNKIPTGFMKDISSFRIKEGKQVIKPIISASGDNTYIIEKEADLEQCEGLTDIMVQPYIESTEDGEISVVIISHDIKYGVIRHPGVFGEYQKETYLPKEKLPKEVMEMSEKIAHIPEYQEAGFMRIDFLYNKETYYVLEMELVDPDLFIESIPDKKVKNQIYQDLVDMVKEKL